MVTEEARVIVVVDEETSRVHISERKVFCSVAVINLSEGLAGAEHIVDCIVHRVIENTG